MYRDLICEPMRFTYGGREWWMQRFNHWDGTVEAVNLYDENGDFVGEFSTEKEMNRFLEGIE